MMEEETRSSRDGRVPPQDVVAEKSLLGALMISNEVLPDVLTVLRPRDFYFQILCRQRRMLRLTQTS